MYTILTKSFRHYIIHAIQSVFVEEHGTRLNL